MTVSVARRLWTTLPLFAPAAAGAIVLAPTLGSTAISLRRVFDTSVPWTENIDAQIFFVARLPRVLAAALVGAALAASGVVLQALLRNPLATPFTLGVSAGAALGAMLAIAVGLDLGALGVSSVAMASFLGSMVATALVYWLARSQRRGLSTNVLLLAGVTLNSFFSALILFVQYLADFTQSFRTMRWLMGDLDVGSYGPMLAALPLVTLAFAAFAVLPRTLNLLTLGTDAAAAAGWTWCGPNGWPSSVRRWPPAPRCRWPVRSGSSASSCRTSCGCWSAPITGWCCPRRRCSAPPSSSAATWCRGRRWRRSNCRSVSSRR